MTEDCIVLEGMRFYGRHGTLPAERELGQEFVVTVELRCDLRAAGTAVDLHETVDYSQVYRQARAVVEGPPVGLTETVAERIAAAVLAEHGRVEAVRVRVTKPHVHLGGALAGATVEIVRRRASVAT